MEAHLTQVLNGIARSMAPSGLTKALSLGAVRLASQERVQQRSPPERRFGKISCEDRILQCSVDQIVREMVEQLEEVPNMVSQGGIQRRTVEQIVGFLRNLQRTVADPWTNGFTDRSLRSAQDLRQESVEVGYPSRADFWYRSAQDLVPGESRGSQNFSSGADF